MKKYFVIFMMTTVNALVFACDNTREVNIPIISYIEKQSNTVDFPLALYVAVTDVYPSGGTTVSFIELDICNIPDSTRNFVKNEIANNLNEIAYRGDKETFELLLSPLRDGRNQEFPEIYAFTINVHSDTLARGGIQIIRRLLVDSNGNVIFGLPFGPFSWEVGLPKKNENGELTVDIITDIPGRHAEIQNAVITTYSYNGEELILLNSRNENLLEYWN